VIGNINRKRKERIMIEWLMEFFKKLIDGED